MTFVLIALFVFMAFMGAFGFGIESARDADPKPANMKAGYCGLVVSLIAQVLALCLAGASR